MKKRVSAFHQQTSRCCLVNEQAWLQASEVTSNVEDEEGFHWAKGVAKHGVQLITTSLPLSFHQTDIFTKGSGQYSNGIFSFVKLFLIGNYIPDLQGFFLVLEDVGKTLVSWHTAAAQSKGLDLEMEAPRSTLSSACKQPRDFRQTTACMMMEIVNLNSRE